MIAFITGTIEEKSENGVVINCNGMGYEVQTSIATLSSLPLVGEECKIYTYLQVKEDGISLFGFTTVDERELFYKLISVSGVGPKMAITVLSGMNISDLIVSILKEDTTALSRIKGLGKKTAERICLELKDKLTPVGGVLIDDNVIEINENVLDDACEALISLGLSKNEALRLARQNANENSTAEEIITSVLRNMGR
ncbi:MAG TPA: Holliday junction branch migration protein RuvA [Candidatus Caccopulliclostridium gallistercoris]|uniref:Holliday junction branch migration complex subunit RuvA n=1 Tax=Candidatus Caccopulliclostridium gallistercoris TaxID=2840719 RepID=A0A9D1NEZ6_9FIRM|nr:Holliday junction branch migration protein RuvA [Candidatus Caccopulliclostridium gallistercoris]